jgi:transcriptional regulator with XRE-family HTH domain
MKKRENIRDEFGIPQVDLAILLKVTRSQLAMFETGKRELPSAAMSQLLEMLRFAQKDTSKLANTISLMNTQVLQKNKALEHLVKENHFKQFELEKKLNALEKKYNSNLMAIQLINYFEQLDTKNYELGKQTAKIIEKKAIAELNKNGLAMITKCKIEKEVLQAEEKIILQFMKNE